MDLLPRLYPIHSATDPFARKELKHTSCKFYSLKEERPFITQRDTSFMRNSPSGQLMLGTLWFSPSNLIYAIA